MEILTRRFVSDLEKGDGRTIVGRAVPFNVKAKVGADAWHPSGPYTEMFINGAFRKAVKAPDRVFLAFEHQTGLLDQVGRGASLEERDDGLWGEWRVLDGYVGDHTLEMVGAKMLRALSVGFWPLGNTEQLSDGTFVRTKVRLDEVSLCREAAYTGAEVVSVRSQLAQSRRAQYAPAPASDLDDRLRKLGYLPKVDAAE